MPQKHSTAVYKDSVTAELALRAHFFIADEYPKDTTIAHFGKKMLLQIQNSTGIPYFTGEYYEACKRFAEENHTVSRSVPLPKIKSAHIILT